MSQGQDGGREAHAFGARGGEGIVPDQRAYPPEAILTTEQLAAWLQVSVTQVQRMDLPAVPVGKRRYRYIAGQVLEELRRRAE